MTIDIIGGKREEACRDFLREKGGILGFSSVLVLPIPSTRNGISVTGTELLLATLAEDSGGKLIAGYSLPSGFVSLANEHGAYVCDVAGDEIFTEENARLTAEGTLSYVMNSEEKSLSDMRVGIVGYGRIGRTLAELLLFFGARVTVITRRESVKLELLFSGVDAILVPDARLSDFDVLVNTAPARLFTKKQCDGIRGTVIELAPGENLPWVQNLTRLPSLPAKRLPISGGRAYAAAILRCVADKGEK